jgi:hypothetical protein
MARAPRQRSCPPTAGGGARTCSIREPMGPADDDVRSFFLGDYTCSHANDDSSTPASPTRRRISAESFVTILPPDLEDRIHERVMGNEPFRRGEREEAADLSAVDAVLVAFRHRERLGLQRRILRGETSVRHSPSLPQHEPEATGRPRQFSSAPPRDQVIEADWLRAHERRSQRLFARRRARLDHPP